MKGTKTVKADTTKLGERVAGRAHPNRSGLPHGHGELPYDLPVQIEVERVLAPVGDPPSVGLVGWILEVDCFVHDHTKVWLKMYRDPKALAIEVDGKEVWRWIAHPDDAPVKFHEVREQAARLGNDLAEALELEPGDELLDGELPGTYEVIRGDNRVVRKVRKQRPVEVEGDDVLD